MSDGAYSGFKTNGAQEKASAHETQTQPGAALAGFPRQEDDRSESYNTHNNNVSDAVVSEASPSAGWRAVYAAMGVDE